MVKKFSKNRNQYQLYFDFDESAFFIKIKYVEVVSGKLKVAKITTLYYG